MEQTNCPLTANQMASFCIGGGRLANAVKGDLELMCPAGIEVSVAADICGKRQIHASQ